MTKHRSELHAFGFSEKLKERVLRRLRKRRRMWLLRHDDTNGYRLRSAGAAGSMLEPVGYEEFEHVLGIPASLAELVDVLHLALPAEKALGGQCSSWPYRFVKAVPLGANLTLVWARFCLWMVCDRERGLGSLVEGAAAASESIARPLRQDLEDPDRKRVRRERASVRPQRPAASLLSKVRQAAQDVVHESFAEEPDVGGTYRAVAQLHGDAAADAEKAMREYAVSASEALLRLVREEPRTQRSLGTRTKP